MGNPPIPKRTNRIMKPEQQRIAIAEACGWKWHSRMKGSIKVWDNGLDYVFSDSELPDYLNDLNAMHEAVKSLPQNLKPRYFAHLCTVVSGAVALHGYSEATEATAAQRAEAFLRTLNLWNE